MSELFQTQKQPPVTYYVAIGSSAGGLEALTQLIANLPDELPFVYLIAQHMSPDHRSMLSDILSRETNLTVKEISNDEIPQIGTLYIIPPGFNLLIKNQKFSLKKPKRIAKPNPSIDLLFQSLAENFADNVIGIILSGTGRDGTEGLKAIKCAGGITLVQTPDSAKYSGMPNSAIESGIVDRILEPEQMAQELTRLIRFSESDPITNEQQEELNKIFHLVRDKTRIDFSNYKLPTLLRRLKRRLLVTSNPDLKHYLAYLNEHPDESLCFAKDSLISVTGFYRDTSSFNALESYIQKIVEKKGEDEIRAWVPGCASGEEAYSIAMLFAKYIVGQLNKSRLQIFATDIDTDALAVARRGFYPADAFDNIDPDYFQRYFIPSQKGFEPIKAIRDCVIFARQDIINDPPFLKMDLISCRNLLIYFNPHLQSQVITTLHYALEPSGILFLGKSETVGKYETIFAPLDRKARIFQKRGKTLAMMLANTRQNHFPISLPPQRKLSGFESLFLNAVGKVYAENALLVDASFNILYMHGSVNKFIVLASGSPDMNIARLIIPEFSNDILTTLQTARYKQKPSFSPIRPINSLAKHNWRLAVYPVEHSSQEEIFLVCFESIDQDASDYRLASVNVEQLLNDSGVNEELQVTREQLQNLYEEMSASNERMQALNEEVQASNEELQATNEELEAANVELQATNEELISVNEESLIKSAELAAINSEFESLYNTIDFPVIVFDQNLSIKRVNRAAQKLYDIPIYNRSNHFKNLDLPEFLNGIEQKLLNALANEKKESFSVQDEIHNYQIYITPTQSTPQSSQSIVLIVIDNTKLLKAREEVKFAQQRLLEMTNHSSSLVSIKDTAGRYEFVNAPFEQLFGIKLQDLVGKTDQQVFPMPIAQQLREPDIRILDKQKPFNKNEILILGENKVFLTMKHFPIFDMQGVLTSICMDANDITDQQQQLDQLNLVTKVFEQTGEGIMITDPQGVIVSVNSAFSNITGYSEQQALGQTPSLLKSGIHDKAFYRELWCQLVDQGFWQGEITNRKANGNFYPQWMTINAVNNLDGELSHYVTIFSDISSIKNSQKRIEHLATHDELTGLANRSLLMDRLNYCLSQAKRQNENMVVFFIDLDNFKLINDALGHDIGDTLLKQASQRLLSTLRAIDTLARLGGDEFVAILNKININEINNLALRIIDEVSNVFEINQHSCYVSASIGISLYPQDGQDAISLLKNADTAMYQSKENGRNQFQFFNQEMRLKSMQRMSLETGLRLALEQKSITLLYQPKIDIRSGLIIGAEALARWKDPILGQIPPSQFIPVAEQSQLIRPLSEQILHQAVAQLQHWTEQEIHIPNVAINLSAKQLQDKTFTELLKNIINDNPWLQGKITLEITESMLMEKINKTTPLLKQLAMMGFLISIDDFGTGYSSLSYLKRLPIHELKIDKSFIDAIDKNDEDYAITHAIVKMAQALNLHIVAEGVESKQQLDVLQSLNCDTVQGYFYFPPLPAEKLAEIVARQV